MINCYCREHLIFFNAFCGTDITIGAQYATLILSSCPGASIEQWEILFITQYFNFILVDNEVSHCGNNFMDTIFKFLHSIIFTLTLQISKLKKAVVLNSFPHGRFWQFVYKECQVYSINTTFVTSCNTTNVRALLTENRGSVV